MNTCLNSYLLEWLLGIQKGANVKHCRIKLIVLTWPGTSSGLPCYSRSARPLRNFAVFNSLRFSQIELKLWNPLIFGDRIFNYPGRLRPSVPANLQFTAILIRMRDLSFRNFKELLSAARSWILPTHPVSGWKNCSRKLVDSGRRPRAGD